jgi:phosphoesterase RecJ-like protein
MLVDWQAFAKIVHDHERFVLTSHIRPDCDALGSELGMAGVLDALGKDVKIVNGQATPANLAFLDPHRRIQAINEQVSANDLTDRQVLMILDTSSWAQLGPMSDFVRSTRASKLIIDHHIGEDDLGAIPFKDTGAEATGRLVVEAADALAVNLSPEMAVPLFAALATDTGWFRFASVTSRTCLLAARLIEAGAVPAPVYRELYEQETLGRMKLRGLILSRLRTDLDGRLVHTFVRKTDFAETGSMPQDTEDAINLSLAIGGTEGAVIFVEQPSGGIKISFRSRGKMDCNQVACHFGGGGHKAAAGASVNEPLEVARQRVLDRVREAMQ